MTRSQQLAHIVRAAAQRIRVSRRHMPERRGEWLASIRALMEAVPGGAW